MPYLTIDSDPVRRNKSKLTCAGLHALEPCVVEFGVARISTVVGPSTAGSATAGFAGFLGDAALGAVFCCSRARRRCVYGHKSIDEQMESTDTHTLCPATFSGQFKI